MSTPIEPIFGPRIEPPTPPRRVDRARRDQQRGGQGQSEHDQHKPDDEDETDENTGLHVDILA